MSSNSAHEVDPQASARFGWLLASLIALLALVPIIGEFNPNIPRLRIVFSGVLIAGIYSLSDNRRTLWVGLALAAPALSASWATQFTNNTLLVYADFALNGSFLAVTLVVILHAILRQERVTADTVLGGICVYLLLGAIWLLAYSALEFAAPGSFLQGGESLSALRPEALESNRFPELLYFSFVTLTTLGYGDITPTSHAARALATGEAITGQLYLAIFVARLVGLHLAHGIRRN